MKRNRNRVTSVFDLGRVPVSEVKREQSVGTLKQYRETLAREDQESAARLQSAIAAKQAEASRTIAECLTTSAPLKAKFWSQPNDTLKNLLHDEEAFDELFLQKDSADVDSNEIYDRVMTFLTSMPSLEAEDERRFSLYVACQVLNDVIVDDESLKVMFDRCLLLGIFKGTAELQRPATPKPLVIEPKRESLEDFESIDTTSRDGSRRAKNLAENLYVEEMIPIATAFVTSIQKHYGFSPTSEDMRRVSTWIERNNFNRLAPQTYDAARRWMVASGYWPESCLMETEKFNLSLESIDTSRLTVAQRNDLNRRELQAREADARRFGR